MKNRYYKRSRLSEVKFRKLLKLFCLDVPALTAAQLARVNRNTAQTVYGLMRQRLVELAQKESKPFTGEIEVDESYFGARRVRGKRGRGASAKTPVIGLLKRGGRVYTTVVPNCSREELLPIIRGKVLTESTVYTDGWRSYDGLVLNGYQHHRIHHHRNEFARGKNHVNGIESFWAFAKTRMVKLRGIRKNKFLFHLKESEWRWNHRKEDRFSALLIYLSSHPLN